MSSKLRGAGVIAATLVLAVVAAGSWFALRGLTGPSCSGEVPLAVAAAPEIAPAVQAAADQWMSDGAAVGGTCVKVVVAAADSVDVAAAVAGKHGASLSGVGQASGTAITPDVWVPDSSTWLLRLTSGGAAAFDPGNGASIARSPVVVAMPEPVATAPRLAGQEALLVRPAAAGSPRASRCGPASSSRPGTPPVSPPCCR